MTVLLDITIQLLLLTLLLTNLLNSRPSGCSLILDGLTEETTAVVQGSLGKVTPSFKHRKGSILLTSRTKQKNVVLQAKEISLSTG